MYYNQTILNSDHYFIYITIIKSDNNMTTEALKHYEESGTRWFIGRSTNVLGNWEFICSMDRETKVSLIAYPVR